MTEVRVVTIHYSLFTSHFSRSNEHLISCRLQFPGEARRVFADRKCTHLDLVESSGLGHVGVKPLFAKLGRPGLGVLSGKVRRGFAAVETPRLRARLGWGRGPAPCRAPR